MTVGAIKSQTVAAQPRTAAPARVGPQFANAFAQLSFRGDSKAYYGTNYNDVLTQYMQTPEFKALSPDQQNEVKKVLWNADVASSAMSRGDFTMAKQYGEWVTGGANKLPGARDAAAWGKATAAKAATGAATAAKNAPLIAAKNAQERADASKGAEGSIEKGKELLGEVQQHSGISFRGNDVDGAMMSLRRRISESEALMKNPNSSPKQIADSQKAVEVATQGLAAWAYNSLGDAKATASVMEWAGRLLEYLPPTRAIGMGLSTAGTMLNGAIRSEQEGTSMKGELAAATVSSVASYFFGKTLPGGEGVVAEAVKTATEQWFENEAHHALAPHSARGGGHH